MIEIESELIPHPYSWEKVMGEVSEWLKEYLVMKSGSNISEEEIRRAMKYALGRLAKNYQTNEGVVYFLKSPLLSETASGRWEEFVYVTRNGKTFLRRYVYPFDPRTSRQNQQRHYFRLAVQCYRAESEESRNEWKKKAESMSGLSGYNLYLREKIKELKNG